jgi:hypothetical protein
MLVIKIVAYHFLYYNTKELKSFILLGKDEYLGCLCTGFKTRGPLQQLDEIERVIIFKKLKL